ncbi:hypothetical protein IQ251_09490 [Saccharopolyspora sp. HNM0983]|uniref:ABC-2 type transport system permease protein n=1 Tax=Saccharopolyspora montiporae TaxID=2781240 RepID=A0A929FZT6_9PSEU|nr:hypothetical protein [Saccharopolyspora sp. HNM0983]MBE9374679.1 hypothetical protein [Saccharopolyspora sp. HNM0983]
MTQLAVERMKLFSTRSAWWCSFLAIALPMALTALVVGLTEDGSPVLIPQTQGGSDLGLMVVMVLAALSVTTEYRFGTIRATFLAVPNRVSPLVAKAVVAALTALVVGLLGAFGAWAVGYLMATDPQLALDSAVAWRQVAGVGLVFAAGAVLAVGVGTLVRQSAAAITLLLLWPLLVESLVLLIPQVGEDLSNWMPFNMARHFLSAEGAGDMPLGPWAALAYFAAIAVAVLAAGIAVVRRRDA